MLSKNLLAEDSKSRVYIEDGLAKKEYHSNDWPIEARMEWVNREVRNLLFLEKTNFKLFAKLKEWGYCPVPFIKTKYIKGKTLDKAIKKPDLPQKVINYFDAQFNIKKPIYMKWPGETQIPGHHIKEYYKWPYPLSWFMENYKCFKLEEIISEIKNLEVKCVVCRKDPDPTNFILNNGEIISIDWEILLYSDYLLEIGYLLGHLYSEESIQFKKEIIKMLNLNKDSEKRLIIGYLNGYIPIVKKRRP